MLLNVGNKVEDPVVNPDCNGVDRNIAPVLKIKQNSCSYHTPSESNHFHYVQNMKNGDGHTTPVMMVISAFALREDF